MGRSFVLGIAVASVTWAISLYLYWSLMQNLETGSTDSLHDHHRSVDQTVAHATDGAPYALIGNDLDRSNSVIDDEHIGNVRLKNGLTGDDDDKKQLASKANFLSKMRRYKKQQKQRRISQHLIDELKPHQVVIDGG